MIADGALLPIFGRAIHIGPALLGNLAVAALIAAVIWLSSPAKPEKYPQSEFGFRVEFYREYAGLTMSSGNEITNNPILLLVKISNVGSKPNGISIVNLKVQNGAATYIARRLMMGGPFSFGIPGEKVVSPKSDLFPRLFETAIDPGHSLTGAMLFSISDQPAGLLKERTYKSYLILQDIHGAEHEFPAEFDTKDMKPGIIYPGISYE
jgi:hypothetical protein